MAHASHTAALIASDAETHLSARTGPGSIMNGAAAALRVLQSMDEGSDDRQIEVQLNLPLADILARLNTLAVDSDQCKVVEVNTTHTMAGADQQLARFLMNASEYKAVVCKYAAGSNGEGGASKRARNSEPVLGYAVYLN